MTENNEEEFTLYDRNFTPIGRLTMNGVEVGNHQGLVWSYEPTEGFRVYGIMVKGKLKKLCYACMSYYDYETVSKNGHKCEKE